MQVVSQLIEARLLHAEVEGENIEMKHEVGVKITPSNPKYDPHPLTMYVEASDCTSSMRVRRALLQAILSQARAEILHVLRGGCTCTKRGSHLFTRRF